MLRIGMSGWATEKHLDSIPSKLKPTFQQILKDLKTRREFGKIVMAIHRSFL